MARATCPSRCLLNRSVVRRSWPKFENQELVGSTGQRSPRVSGFLVFASPLRFFLAQTMSVTPRSWQRCVVSALS